MNKGLIHVYCGDGKGKTTAALGLAVRAAGSGMRVVILQFLKGRRVSELNSLKLIPGITILRNEKDLGFFNAMTEEDKKLAMSYHNENLQNVLHMVECKECDMLILDEICAAYRLGLVDKETINQLIINKREDLELVLTGRDPDELFLQHADYVSEIKKIKHPYDKKINARIGIEL
jgi:cob(I)alamin adenosyltransferase